eukprot:TRINITY_DN8501_c0_g1_i1.p1 TRINITY_DN8501_c0_g1~~TRINITY_DN8501_c0_g1_i1.p1  ORF type:complete len:406 (-),score=119.22 TRINITY_DN8501_c0_g1_i1:24-1241(-)
MKATPRSYTLSQPPPNRDVTRVYFKDGAFKSLMITPETSAEELCSAFADKINMTKFARSFQLKETKPSGERLIDPHEKVWNVKKSWEQEGFTVTMDEKWKFIVTFSEETQRKLKEAAERGPNQGSQIEAPKSPPPGRPPVGPPSRAPQNGPPGRPPVGPPSRASQNGPPAMPPPRSPLPARDAPAPPPARRTPQPQHIPPPPEDDFEEEEIVLPVGNSISYSTKPVEPAKPLVKRNLNDALPTLGPLPTQKRAPGALAPKKEDDLPPLGPLPTRKGQAPPPAARGGPQGRGPAPPPPGRTPVQVQPRPNRPKGPDEFGLDEIMSNLNDFASFSTPVLTTKEPTMTSQSKYTGASVSYDWNEPAVVQQPPKKASGGDEYHDELAGLLLSVDFGDGDFDMDNALAIK